LQLQEFRSSQDGLCFISRTLAPIPTVHFIDLSSQLRRTIDKTTQSALRSPKMSERTRSSANAEASWAVNLRSHRVLTIWMTVLIYGLSGCAFINSGHCCSGHSHPDVQPLEDHDHLPTEDAHDDIAVSDSGSVPNDFSLSKRHCCGQGLHGESDRIALHVASCLRSSDPSRMVKWLSASDEADYGQPDSPYVRIRSCCALSRPSARSPALESILTVSLLI